MILTGVWTEYGYQFREKLWEYPKNIKSHIFTPPGPLGSINSEITILPQFGSSANVKAWSLLQFILQTRQKISLAGYWPYRVSVSTKHHLDTTYLKWRPHFGFKNRFITTLDVFAGRFLHEVVDLGSELIGLWLIFTKCINFWRNILIMCVLHILLSSE